MKVSSFKFQVLGFVALMVAGMCQGATRGQRPEADGEGSIGTADYNYASVYAKTGTFDVVTGVVQDGLPGGNIGIFGAEYVVLGGENSNQTFSVDDNGATVDGWLEVSVDPSVPTGVGNDGWNEGKYLQMGGADGTNAVIAEAVARAGGLSASLRADRPVGASISVTTDNITTWYSNITNVASFPPSSTMLVWAAQLLDDRISLPITTNSTIRGATTYRTPIIIDWDTSTTPANHQAALSFTGATNTFVNIDLINLCDNVNAVAYGYTLVLYNNMTVRDCGIYMVGRYRHSVEAWGYKTLVLTSSAGQSKVYNCVVGALSTDESGNYGGFQYAALHGAVAGSEINNTTFISARAGEFDLAGKGSLALNDCKSNTATIYSTEVLSEDAVRVALSTSLHRYLPYEQNLVNTKISAVTYITVGAQKVAANKFAAATPAAGFVYAFDPDNTTTTEIAAVLASLIHSLDLIDYALSFDGVDDYVDCRAALLPATGDFSLSIDFKTDTVAVNQTLFSQYLTGRKGRVLFRIDSGTLRLFIGDSSGNLEISGGTVVVGTAHTAALTRTGDVFAISLDDIAVNSASAALTIYQGDANIGIEVIPVTSTYFDGTISSFSVDGVVAYPIDEGGGTILYDSTNNQNDGLIIGATWTGL